MKLNKFIFSIFLLTFAVFFQLAGLNSSYAKPDLPEPDRKIKPMELKFRDTNSVEGRALINSLDSFYRIQVANGFNGSVLVGYKGQILYRRYFGVANKSSNLMWNRNTSSQLASTSKPFTAVAILWLAQNGYLDIDKPVKKYLKEFPYETITVRMLLCHTAGLSDYTKMGLNYWRNNNLMMYNHDLLLMFAKHKPKLRFTPNTRFEYSNSNYAFLARIVEEVAQMRFQDFMRIFIFEPLGMKNTFVYDVGQNMPTNRSQGYKANWAVHGDMYADGVTGDKGIFSTVEDMYKWDQSFYNNSILNKKWEMMSYTPQISSGSGGRYYGLGWRMIVGDKGKLIFHNGNWHSNNILFYRYINDNFTIIVLGNKYNTGIYRQGKPIYDIVKQYEKLTSSLVGDAD